MLLVCLKLLPFQFPAGSWPHHQGNSKQNTLTHTLEYTGLSSIIMLQDTGHSTEDETNHPCFEQRVKING